MGHAFKQTILDKKHAMKQTVLNKKQVILNKKPAILNQKHTIWHKNPAVTPSYIILDRNLYPGLRSDQTLAEYISVLHPKKSVLMRGKREVESESSAEIESGEEFSSSEIDFNEPNLKETHFESESSEESISAEMLFDLESGSGFICEKIPVEYEECSKVPVTKHNCKLVPQTYDSCKMIPEKYEDCKEVPEVYQECREESEDVNKVCVDKIVHETKEVCE